MTRDPLVPAELVEPACNRIGAEEVECEPARDFDHRVEALGQHADDEHLVNALFLHGGLQRSDFRFGVNRLTSRGANPISSRIPIHRFRRRIRARVGFSFRKREFLATRWGGRRPVELEEG